MASDRLTTIEGGAPALSLAHPGRPYMPLALSGVSDCPYCDGTGITQHADVEHRFHVLCECARLHARSPTDAEAVRHGF